MGGDVTLDRDAARAVIERAIARPLGLSTERAAIGILQIADTMMAQAVRRVTIERGRDPRRHALFAFGGAGPMHATSIARMLGIRDVVIPPDPGVFSALGMLHMPLRADRTKSALLALSDDGLHEARRIAGELAAEAAAALGGDGGTAGVALDLRYRGQDHPVRVEYAGGCVADVLAAFESSYETRYGYAIPDQPVEIVKVTAWREILQDAPPWRLDTRTAAPASLTDRQPICFGDDGGWLEGAIWWRPGCPSGTVLAGPGLVVEPTSTTVLAPGDRATVGDVGELRIAVGDA
jgi:N-methylhydantoinase A